MSATPSSPPPRDVYFHDHPVRVTYRDTDQMGFSYYGNYFTYMEIGRVEYLRARGWSYRQLEEMGIRLPVLHAACDYSRPALYDDLLRVRAMVEEITRARVSFRYEIYCDERQELLATGTTRHAFTGPGNRPRRVPSGIVAILTGPPKS